MQSDIEHYQDRMERENYRFDITKLGGSLAKNDRIRKLIPVFEQGRVWMPRSITHVNYEGIAVDVVQSFIDDEYKAFPVGQHDDMLDCLARIVDPDLLAVFPQVEEFVLPRREGLRSPAQSY
jgi:phage terminase large subunit-like protein